MAAHSYDWKPEFFGCNADRHIHGVSKSAVSSLSALQKEVKSYTRGKSDIPPADISRHVQKIQSKRPLSQRGGSVFAVMQSKAVTRTNHISSATVASQETFSQDLNDDQADYENISQTAMAPAESLYVAPLPNAVYENAQSETTTNDAEQVQGVYANFIQSLTIDEDKEDYENSEFLSQVIPEDDEPDYVNELGDCT
ncbi:uncharacterized protein LOC115053875 isoform X2 [Echeneis naucrates]|uniref:uncharacterized protein LOC115053875 isoform X2 n=1 Tax=Echeneis naucrates TaxID=173247 RepID=UPI001114567F|nr:uncharacterized protein LOC115053875 isoform X2 [Echeneis naucrates]